MDSDVGTEKLLRVTGRTYVAGAVWRKYRDGWVCVRTAPILRWMMRKKPDHVQAKLKQVGATYEWM